MISSATGTERSTSAADYLQQGGAAAKSEQSDVSFQQLVDEVQSVDEGSPAKSRWALWAHPSCDPEQVTGSESELGGQNGIEFGASAKESGVAGCVAGGVSPLAEGGPECAAAVREALAAEGLDPDQVTMNYHEEFTWCPGGSWVNKLLRVETADGRAIDFSAALSQESPQVAAWEIRNMLNREGLWAEMGVES